MKKIFFLFVTISLLTSCTTSSTEQLSTADSCVVETVAADTTVSDSIAVVATDTVK